MGHPKTANAVVLEAYDELKERLGRAPTAGELGQATGMSCCNARSRMISLRLERTVLSPSERGRAGGEKLAALMRTGMVKHDPEKRAAMPEKRAMERRDMEETERRMEAEREARRRRAAIRRSGDREKRPERLPMPGEGMEPWALIKASCALCGRPLTLAPRTHPYYIRDAEGAVHFVCGSACMRGEDF